MGLTLGNVILDVAWLCLLVGLWFHFWKKRQFLQEAQGWLKTKGHITQYELVRIGHSLWPKIEYTYCVYDHELRGHYLFLDTMHNTPNSTYSRQVAYTAAVAYQDNTPIDVFYNPNRPEESALDVTIPTKLTTIITLLSLLIILHVFINIAYYF